MPWDNVVDATGLIIVALIGLVGTVVPFIMSRRAQKDVRAVRTSITTNNGGSTMLDKVDAIFKALGELAVNQQAQNAKLDTHIADERMARSRLSADIELIKAAQLSIHA